MHLPTVSFPGGLDSKESVWNVGVMGSIPGLGRFPGEAPAHSSSSKIPTFSAVVGILLGS